MVAGRTLVFVVLTRFLPMSAALVAGPIAVVEGPSALSALLLVIVGLQALGMSAGFLTALFPLRGRLSPAAARSLRWQLGSAAVGVVATGVFSVFTRDMRLVSMLGASVGGGLIAAVPLLLAASARGGWDPDAADSENGPDGGS